MNNGFVIRPLNAAGHVTARPMPPLVRDDYSYIYLLAGEVLTDIGGQPYLIKAQDCALIPPTVPYSVRYFKGAIGYMGAFSGEILRNSAHRVLRLKAPTILTVPTEDKIFTDELMIRMMRYSDDLPMIRSLLEVLLCQYDTAIPKGHETASARICSDFLSKVFDQSVAFRNVSGYAEMIGVSANHLNRAVKSETGRSAGEWIGNARMSLARNLLHDKSLTIAEITDRLGFEDASYFSRFFRRATGMTPTDFRNIV